MQTLHNYRLVCPGATLLREGRVCEACLGKTRGVEGSGPWLLPWQPAGIRGGGGDADDSQSACEPGRQR